jgi:hypothetical protein
LCIESQQIFRAQEDMTKNAYANLGWMEMDIETYKKKKNVSPIKNLQEFN